ncbi:MAG: tripartite tricarboxylate transporter substrate binding protein [Lautropia sp.]
MNRLFKWCVAGLVSVAAAVASAQEFPQRPLRLLVGFAPGGGTDTVARVLAQGIGEVLGQPVVVENRPGASTQIATEIVAKAPADGYTLMLATIAHALNPGLFAKLPYDSLNDFTPVGLVATSPLMVVVSPTVPVSNMKELIAYAKSNPGRLNFGMATGSTPHIAGAIFQKMAGIEFVNVPFKGSALVYPDLIAGRIHFTFDAMVSALPQVQGGKVKGIAVTSAQRSATAPDIPTIAESGLDGFAAEPWFGILAPAATPPAIVNRLNAAVRKAVANPAVREKLVNSGYTIKDGTPAEFATYLRSETEKWVQAAKDSGASEQR